MKYRVLRDRYNGYEPGDVGEVIWMDDPGPKDDGKRLVMLRFPENKRDAFYLEQLELVGEDTDVCGKPKVRTRTDPIKSVACPQCGSMHLRENYRLGGVCAKCSKLTQAKKIRHENPYLGDREGLVRLLESDSMSRIGELHGCSGTVVKRWMEELDIPSRTRSEAAVMAQENRKPRQAIKRPKTMGGYV